MTLALARRPATLDDLVVLVIDATGSDRTAQLSVSVAEQLERRHFVREIRPCTGTAPPVVDPSVAVIVTEEATGDLAVSIAAELEQQALRTYLKDLELIAKQTCDLVLLRLARDAWGRWT